jgi:hypothetical protein
MLAMSSVVSLQEWREGRGRRPRPPGSGLGLPTAGEPSGPVERLERAIQVLDPLVDRLLARGHLEPATETELLAVLGEMALGEVGLAADRAERLAQRIAGEKGGAIR